VEELTMARAPRTALCLAPLALAVALAAAPPAWAQDAARPLAVERQAPVREKLPTLRFLRANRDFLRARFQRLGPGTREERASADALDPRFLQYRRMLAEIAGAKDSVAAAQEAREREQLFASVRDLARLEADLDQMERLLVAQQERLGVLQADFAGRQRTELDVVVTGGGPLGRVDSIVVTLEDGTRVVSGLDDAQRRSLQRGGVLEVFRGRVEPREQVLELRFEGEGWSRAAAGFVRFEPTRDRLTFIRLDLSDATPARGLSSVRAGTWTLDPGGPASASAGDRDRP